MQTISCELCNMKFKTEKYLKAHLKSKRHLMWSETKPTKLHKCHCGKVFSHRQSLYLHKKSCTDTSVDDDAESLKTLLVEERQIHEQEIKTHVETVQELKEELKQLKAEKSVTNNNTTNNNTTNNNTTNNNITINLNTHGKENIDYLSQTDLMKSVSRVFKSVPDLIWKIYFNPNHPENHNVIITDRRSPYINVFTKDKKWKLANKRDTIGSMIDSSYMILDETFENNKSEFSTSIQDGFKRFQDKFEKSEKKTMKEINKEVHMVIMNGPG